MQDGEWASVNEDQRAIRVETDRLEAVIPKRDPKQWMTGIEKGSFLDKASGFREAGDGLMVVDWLMEAGSDASYRDQVIAGDGYGVGRYTWYENETDPERRNYALMGHGSSHRKRMVEGPQLCHRMGPVQPDVIHGEDFIAVETTCRFEYAAPGRKAGSRWTQLIVFPRGERFFVLMDKVDSVNDSEEMFLRNDTPGCVRHVKGDTFSEIYLSYLGGPEGVRIPSSEFFTPFPPDLKFGYRRDLNKTPEHFIRAYHLRGKETGEEGPWLAGLTLDVSVVYEAWCSQRPGDIIVMIEEIHGKPVKAGESFSAVHIVGYFDSTDEMHAVYDRHKGHVALAADTSGWRLVREDVGMDGVRVLTSRSVLHRDEVFRRGNVVIRDTGPWTPAVHALLRHLEKEGFPAPRVVGSGLDQDGRETLSYIEGEAVAPGPLSFECAGALGEMIRHLHEATATFTPPDNARWYPWCGRSLGGPERVIGHCDLAPWNTICRDGLPVGLIDWDFAGPTDPRVDLAQACWLNAKLHDDTVAEHESLPPLEERAKLLRAIVDAYGLPARQRVGFIDLIIEFIIHFNAWQADEFSITRESRVTDPAIGWAFAWPCRGVAWIHGHRSALQNAIT